MTTTTLARPTSSVLPERFAVEVPKYMCGRCGLTITLQARARGVATAPFWKHHGSRTRTAFRSCNQQPIVVQLHSDHKFVPSVAWIESHIDADGDCWLWMGGITKRGYGIANLKNAHRTIYEVLVSAVPSDMHLDHLCRNTSCVNPDHMEVVTQRVNVLRGYSPPGLNARKTHCAAGHPFDVRNTYTTPTGDRRCRRCDADRHLQQRHALMASGGVV